MTQQITQGFLVDGNVFETRAEANAYLRRPKIIAALNELTEGNEGLSQWMVENQDTIEAAFETGTVRRVKVVDRNRLTRAFAAVNTAVTEDNLNLNQDMQFLIDNAEQLVESFRWPKVKRLSPEEKALQAKNTLMAATENDEDLSTWIIEHQDQLIEAFASGIEKRTPSPKAMAALEAYRLKKAAEKAAAEEAEAEG